MKNYSDHELLKNLKQEVARERHALVLVLEYLTAVEDRLLYNKLGYSTLWEFVVQELGYDSGAAQRRINAMRALRQVPEIKQALRSATLTLTTVSMVEQFTKNEKKLGRKIYTITEKRDLLTKATNKSTRETEALLKAISPDSILPPERTRYVSADRVEISFIADEETAQLIAEMKQGTDDLNNLTLVCKPHNLYAARLQFGVNSTPAREREI